ncbi:hypothetical protein RF11_10298 [Thelohanellus kitauei]|uniref:Uncharacterized protein n=1 Tax=Thelohanellus kitauei TaxID=669202 RepID=A0A0C2MTZ5_THEKT|nr:hypothetical protein RF11_10298 [Thelohanellus kitauei]
MCVGISESQDLVVTIRKHRPCPIRFCRDKTILFLSAEMELNSLVAKIKWILSRRCKSATYSPPVHNIIGTNRARIKGYPACHNVFLEFNMSFTDDQELKIISMALCFCRSYS